MVWRFVLHAFFGLFQDLHAVALSQPIFIPLDQSRREAGPCHGHNSNIMDDLCCVHSLHTSGGILGLHPPRPGLLSAPERLVGKCGATHVNGLLDICITTPSFANAAHASASEMDVDSGIFVGFLVSESHPDLPSKDRH